MKSTVLLPLLYALPLFAHGTEPVKPNIIYILADDLGYGDISALNPNGKIHTPNIDLLCKQGMRFTDAHTASSVSTPSRYSILTGRYNWRSDLQNGVGWSFSKPLIEATRPTVATMLAQNGYSTAVVGKWHLGLGWERSGAGENDVVYTKPLNFSPRDNGFQYSMIMPASLDIPPYVYIRNGEFTAPVNDTIAASTGYGFYRTGAIADDFDINTAMERFTDESISYISKQSEANKPFFLYFPLTAPHTPILPPAQFQGKSNTNPYGDFVMYVDHIVGRIVDAVDKAGIKGNTIIIFTSDNGCSPSANFGALADLGHSPSATFRGMKADSYDGGHRVPFIVSWPNCVKFGSRCNDPISLTSFMATCADIIGVELKDCGEDSFSIYPDLKGKTNYAKSRGRKIVIQHSNDGQFSIRKGKWKLITCPYSGGWSEPTRDKVSADMPAMQLFDMDNNSSENSSENMYCKRPDIVRNLLYDLQWAINNGRTTPGTALQNNVQVEMLK